MQDPEFKSERRFSLVGSLLFDLSLPKAPAQRQALLSATPSGKPFMMAPTGFEFGSDRNPGGVFMSMQIPVKGTDPRIRLLSLHFRQGGREGIGLMTCRCTLSGSVSHTHD
jgi:hypothetical protein